jgi:hypothetical protein
VRTVVVGSPADVYPLLQRAKQNRSVARTKCNEHSSRSHSVFQVQMASDHLLVYLSFGFFPNMRLTLNSSKH